jgi:cellulose synthase/poly-beta-1,6-N-acetylglucosamine synthase-like glycosyltransferase
MKKKKDSNKIIFADPTRKRIYIFSVIFTVLLFTCIFLKIYYPNILLLISYKLFPYRLSSARVINRIFSVLIALNFVKLFMWVILSRKSKVIPEPNESIRVTAVIPAFNEEKVIEKTVQSILDSDYKRLDVIVVDDGSNDRTSEIVTEKFGKNPRVNLITKLNGGKADALNVGISKAKGSILILLDADTIVEPDAVSRLVPHFKNKSIAAVSGNTRVGNVTNIITKCQRVEYIRDFNLIKNGMSKLNCMAVVPGALGAWRKDAIQKVGGFSVQTLGEDRDLTMALLKAGYKINFEPMAFSKTEAPSSLRDFMKQRFRWTYSTMQCVKKYLGSFLSLKRPSMGWILMPDLIISQILIPTVTTITFIINLFLYTKTEIMFLLIVLAATLLLNIILLLLSLRITKEKFGFSDIVFVPIQWLIYGFLCTFILYKSLIVAFIGGKVGWNKVKRIGNSH